ncbi:hypothetical protein BX600DRAFT_507380 [Xylariales sp. PMI_506]|nr:hypothetical protein BX600DRAFT_507380 [Xylariales sp. PMI_506]
MRSCWECRRRKIKCDLIDPCAHCVRHKTQCIFTTHTDVGESGLSRTRSGPEPAPSACIIIDSNSNPSATLLSSDSRHGGSAITGASSPSCLPSATGPSHPRGVPVQTAALEHREQVYPSPPEATGTTARVLQSASAAPSLSANTPSSSASDPIQILLQRIKSLEDSYSILSSQYTASDERRVSSIVGPREPEFGSEDNAVRHANASRGTDSETRDWQDVVKNKSRNLGRTRRMGDAPDFAPIIECYSVMLGKTSKDVFSHVPRIEELLVEGGKLLVESKHIAQRLKRGRPSRLAPTPSVAPRLGQYLVPPSRERADAMAKLYFESFESTYRILHLPTFWTNYEQYWQAPESVTSAVYLQILLVVAIGSSLYDHGDGNAVLDNIEMSRPCIYAAENWLAGPLEKDRLDIGSFQVYCLCIMARQIFSVGGDLVWISMGSLLHRAMQGGLHREPRHLPGISMFHAELRRRLWATILDMVVQASLDASMPPRISLDEFDIEPPSNINDEEIDESTTIIVPHPRTTLTSTSVQLTLLDTLPVRLGIVQYLNGLHSKQSYSRVLSLSSQLASALHRCSDLGAIEAQPQNQPNNADNEAITTTIASCSITSFQRNHLDYLVRRFMIPLHMFFVTQTRSNPIFQHSLTVSLDAALALISAATPTTTTTSSCGNDNEAILFDRLLSMAGGLFREGFRAAMIAITLELLVHVAAQQESGTLHRAPQHRAMLKAVVRDLVALAERRVRHGDTNIKGYMFLNMVLAQVEAVEAGLRSGDGAFEMALARGAVESLRFCRDEMKARANMVVLEGGDEMEFDVDGLDLAGSMDSEAFGMDWDWESFLTTGHVYGG